MMRSMRTTIDLPPGLHERLRSYAKTRGESLSATVTELLTREMASVETPSSVMRISPITGLMTVNFGRGRVVTSEEVADLIDEDD